MVFFLSDQSPRLDDAVMRRVTSIGKFAAVALASFVFSTVFALLYASAATTAPSRTRLSEPDSILHAATRVDAHWWAHNTPGDCNWAQGTLFTGKAALCKATGDSACYGRSPSYCGQFV